MQKCARRTEEEGPIVMNRAEPRPVRQFASVSGFSFLCYDIEDTSSDDLCRGKSENSFRAHVEERLGGSKKPLCSSIIYPIAKVLCF